VRASVFGCSLKGHKVFTLGQTTSCIRSRRVAPVTVAGELAAYGLEQCGVDAGLSNVVVRRLTDGVQLRSLPATTRPLGPESYQSVASLVLKSDGAVAWIGAASSIIRRGSYAEVHRADRRGQALLDSGAAIDPRSLRLHGSTFSWRHADFTRGSSLQ
jgi:hypothetical protein